MWTENAGLQTAGADHPRTPDRGDHGGKGRYHGVNGVMKGRYWYDRVRYVTLKIFQVP